MNGLNNISFNQESISPDSNNVSNSSNTQHSIGMVSQSVFNVEPGKNSPSSLTADRVQVLNEVEQIKALGQSGNVSFTFEGGSITDFLRNQAECNIEFEGKTFKCVDGAFHWKKWQLAGISDVRMEEFCSANGDEALKLSFGYFQKTYASYADWSKQREHWMWEILNIKFNQNPHFRALLNATAGAAIINHSNKEGVDPFWTDNHTGTGQNILGKMLQAIRENQPSWPSK